MSAALALVPQASPAGVVTRRPGIAAEAWLYLVVVAADKVDAARAALSLDGLVYEDGIGAAELERAAFLQRAERGPPSLRDAVLRLPPPRRERYLRVASPLRDVHAVADRVAGVAGGRRAIQVTLEGTCYGDFARLRRDADVMAERVSLAVSRCAGLAYLDIDELTRELH